ncbi:PLP-dependent aminotransferase family protein [Chitinophaga polysaccharea]|uniref:aminotransferase-like domain-containing protein n=1 Tax=Chitinophaga polysaccharea TaxID=1293035 RepID=UPI001454FE79|nr:PLP-dependent aminotransferase family protein [Chitinophaga polysaccharea]NLR59406.1 PLP-dependent aminotransferase family protein [Chitinophaga polysaccharea]
MKKSNGFIYLKLAENIQHMISEGVYAVGDKLPSVRSLHLEHGVSISTALQVYTHLEKKGWVTSREKSGYFVRYARQLRPQLPPVTNPAPRAGRVQINEKLAVFRKTARSEKTISLIGASPDTSLMPATKLKKALQLASRELDKSFIPYGDITGHEPFRRHIARHCLNWGRAFSPSEIIVTNGAIEAASLCLRAVANAGDTIAIESPTFFGLLLAIESLGMKALEIPTDPVTGVSLDVLEDAFKQKKVQACLFVSNYSNPLGSCMPDNSKEQLAKMLQKYQVPLIEDDVYGDLHFAPERPRTIKSYDEEGLVLYCSSFSKSIAAGLRIGWVIGGRYHEKVAQLKFMSSASTGILPQLVLTKFLDQQRLDLHLKSLRQALSMQTMQITKAIQEYFPEDTQLTRPNGGISLWVVLPPKVNTWQLHDASVAHGITFTPGALFSSQQRYQNCIRLTNANPWNDDQDWAIRTIGELSQQQLKG